MSEESLRKVYGLLTGLERGLVPKMTVHQSLVDDFRGLVARVEELTGDDLSNLKNVRLESYNKVSKAKYEEFYPRVSQLKSYLEHAHQVGDRVVEIGSLYNSITDQELRSRCADLLSAASHFDRVINQATLVLEDRIRKTAGADRRLTGVQLVNEYIKARPSDSVIIVSDVQDEQEGFANLCRGVMQALRNETHHHLAEKFSRAEAFHICGFIDRLLKLIDGAKVRTS